ncbi:MAG: ABC transporter [Fibrobacteraceae bacterium]|nr:ABC transporter [Fibrobacteraceae bacterium]
MANDFINIRGCRLHNLKNVSAQFPLGKITVVCGCSGCGKSTLVLDTLHGESKRRYLETLSPFACELLGGKRTIPLDSAQNLPASLAISASHGEAPSKAYALSIAECDSALRNLFATYAQPACPTCHKPMESFSREQIIKGIAQNPEGTKLQFLAEIKTQGTSLDKLSALFLAQGWNRAIADSETISLADLTEAQKKKKPKEFFIVVDRIIIRENTRTRIAEAVDAALKLTHNSITLHYIANDSREVYSTIPRCPQGHGYANFSMEPSLFSPYSKTGCCKECGGTGIYTKITETPNLEQSNNKQNNGEVIDDICPHCHGFRLENEILNASVCNLSWKQILETPFYSLSPKIQETFKPIITDNLKPALSTLLDRIEAINDLGIGYLTPGRGGHTLSGGEMQRLHLASLSTGHLNNLLICLDEPASGLHNTDVEALWKVLVKVQKRGNTLVLIEHHPGIIQRADWIIEMGPGAGEKGGQVLFQGPQRQVLDNPDSPTGNWIRELSQKASHKKQKALSKAPNIAVDHFSLYDMKQVSANFPIKKFSVISGQSGSGKSTLLFKNIAPRAQAGEFEKLGIEKLAVLTTGDFHGNRRSTVLSAINMGNLLRDLFAQLPESKVRGYNASRFATHAPGGRCENCKGEGVIYDPSGYEETECPVCLGRRFKDEILEVRFKSLSIADILDLEVKEAYNLFINMKPFSEKLKPLVDTGLDYIRLGQTTTHLSGGERARLRLSIALSKAKFPNTLFLFDEPARGLHQKDIQHLLKLIRNLTETGHTVIAIEHAQDFVNEADYVVELSRK